MLIKESTKDMALEMAKKLLIQHIDQHRERMWFKSPWPDDKGRYYIIQSYKTDDTSLPVDFPNETVYYREVGDGWAISVGY